ncbi:MAG: hypothetical protein QOF77_974 [Solirubrobacteraceae bacterium]|nr:hypothetical protein [Solirubrobacteraceae bacterium]
MRQVEPVRTTTAPTWSPVMVRVPAKVLIPATTPIKPRSAKLDPTAWQVVALGQATPASFVTGRNATGPGRPPLMGTTAPDEAGPPMPGV